MDFNPGEYDSFIAYWSQSGGAEKANYQLFLSGLCRLLGVAIPDAQREENRLNDYVFERSVEEVFEDGSKTTRFIDLYKRNCFVLEAKQSAKRNVKSADRDQLDLLGGSEGGQSKGGTAKRGTAGWDTSMVSALNQARGYAKLLPPEHGWPPFLIIVDVGHVIELWADFSGQGKRYTQFPDRQTYRIALEELRDEKVRTRLRAVWTAPQSLDPTKRSAEVTREIAEQLAQIAKTLEERGNDPHHVAEFLMRCLFTMFAEDVELLPKGCFTDLLEKKKCDAATFRPALENVWNAMNDGGYAGPIDKIVKKFNGWLFKDPRAIDLPADSIHELWVASRREWQDVEPAIFGTLLERALDERERSRLGAHYTPRAYVERLVYPTIIEPLTADWQDVQAQAKRLADSGDLMEARDLVREFHATLCHTRVLDPACGTGNFLYVTMELMKRLEGEVLDTLTAIAGPQKILALPGATVHPTQFLGLEINERAVEIAHLVVWLGFLKWQIRTNGLPSVTEPVLDRTEHIFHRDAVLAYDTKELARDEHGKPLSRWDGITSKSSPVTGEDIPDENARMELFKYENPRRPVWPEAEFIVGNPPFIGNKRMRATLGDGYVAALRATNSDLPASIDYVMYWWDRAADLLAKKGSNLRRFGLITTNSITQPFNRPVVDRRLAARGPLNLVLAVPDHPWVDSADGAAVRVAMTVAELKRPGGASLDGADPSVYIAREASLFEVGAVSDLQANRELSHQGVIPLGEGFRLTLDEASSMLADSPSASAVIRRYRIGRDLVQREVERFIIDCFGLEWRQVIDRYPSVAQILLDRVKPQRDQNNREHRRRDFWLYADSCADMRSALRPLERYIATCRTARHRLFVFLQNDILPDAKIVAIALDSSTQFSTLSSRLHGRWTLATGGFLEDRPNYNHSDTFGKFAFPILEEDSELSAALGTLGDRLDKHRKDRQSQDADLTMTGMYNVLERVRALEWETEREPLTPKEKDIYERGLVGVLKEIHDDIDRAVFKAYGWSDLSEKLVGRPGATLPVDFKATGQEEAEEELLARLVALNRERAEEEKRGIVRWLRPDYQIPRFDKGVVPRKEQIEADVDADQTPPLAPAELPKWPSDQLDQIKVVRAAMVAERKPVSVEEISDRFKGGRNRADAVGRVVDTLVEIGQANREADSGKVFVTR